ncbi:hypothetical protein CP061683_0110A, partial [Chlamydia psittaci 06-1683]
MLRYISLLHEGLLLEDSQ